MAFASRIVFAILAGVSSVAAGPIFESRASISTLSAAQVDSYTPYAYYAGAAYCKPAVTLTWTCGPSCNQTSVSGFKGIASGGDGTITQSWYVGYDTNLKSIIVAYQGTIAQNIVPILTDVDIVLDNLDQTLFPGVNSSVKAHDGFTESHKRSAPAVLAAVKKGIATYSTSQITVVGHSLGGSLAILSSASLALNIPSASVKTVSFSPPRVGNLAFADFANPLADMVRINNKKDFIPILPGRFLGYVHTEGEIHIADDNTWVSCPGQDNTDPQCTIGTVPNIAAGNFSYHSGPFNGIEIEC
ncbi:hypothetical protein GALMADRAFT_91570 [Galerina marginata CBS 339.88]|uniref:Fungal lipase-type domain-containing protein n=1 Tax=Galerina marginata (strain CBS 339.88) TaxID=685588 RepID=A0A067TEV8_GALM3|nr:hypothetical protein GALMADRAFT_91570 [Galerina marginata CBS 339.88]